MLRLLRRLALVAGLICLCATAPQIEIVRDDARTIFISAGRRWGKTFTARLRAISNCLQRPGIRYGYFAPTYSQVITEYEAIAYHSALAGLISKTKLQPYPRIRFWNGSELCFRSMERPENIRGEKFVEIFLDESQDIREETYHSIISPTLRDSRGTIIFAGQFRGRDWRYQSFYIPGVISRGVSAGWTLKRIADEAFSTEAEIRETAQKFGQDTIKTFRAYRYPTSSGLMFSDAGGIEELEQARAITPRAVWDQEYDCIPTAKVNAVFRPEDLAACARGDVRDSGVAGRKYLLSVDIGKIVDPTAWVIIDIQSKTVVASGAMPLRTPHENCAREMARLSTVFCGAETIIDATGGGTGGHRPNDEYLKLYRKLIPNCRLFVWTSAGKERVINDLSIAFERRLLFVPAQNSELRDQLLAYEYTYRPTSNHYDFHGPSGHGDDFVAALAQGWQGILRGWGDQSGLSSAGGVV